MRLHRSEFDFLMLALMVDLTLNISSCQRTFLYICHLLIVVVITVWFSTEAIKRLIAVLIENTLMRIDMWTWLQLSLYELIISISILPREYSLFKHFPFSKINKIMKSHLFSERRFLGGWFKSVCRNFIET